jgi:hypothetical protein
MQRHDFQSVVRRGMKVAATQESSIDRNGVIPAPMVDPWKK